MSMTTGWDPKYEAELDQLVAEARVRDQARLQALPQDQKDRLKRHTDGLSDVNAIAIIYLKAFAEIADGGPLTAAVGREVANWVARVPRDKSGTRIAGIIATGICSSLEAFISDIGDAKITPAVISRLSASRKLPSDPAQAKEKLRAAVRPTLKAEGAKWVNALRDVFSITLAPCTEGTLLPMIRFRHEYVHDPQKAFASVVTGEEVKCWALASILLAHDIALSP